jgi:hypothetical protein
VQGAAAADQHAGREIPHVQGVDVDKGRDPGVRRVQHLKSAVQAPAVHHVRRHPPADPVGCLEEQPVHAGPVQPARSGQPGETATDDDDIHLSGL